MLREWAFGITSECPRVHGLMSMKASVLSSSSILCDGMSPATILQKMQSGSLIGATVCMSALASALLASPAAANHFRPSATAELIDGGVHAGYRLVDVKVT